MQSYFYLARYPFIEGGTVSDTRDRVEQLVAGRRAGTISLRRFKAQIENLTNGELARLAATLLETRPGKRGRLERALRKYGEEQN